MAIALGSRFLCLYRRIAPTLRRTPSPRAFVRQRPSCLANQRSFLLSRLLSSSREGQRSRRASLCLSLSLSRARARVIRFL